MIITAPDGIAGAALNVPVQLPKWELMSATFDLDNSGSIVIAIPLIQIVFAGSTAIIVYRVIGTAIPVGTDEACTAGQNLNHVQAGGSQAFALPTGVIIEATASVRLHWEAGDGTTVIRNCVLNVREHP
jgi:hypothetical protein